MKEIWKDIEGYIGIYQVSNMGRVKSLRDNNLRPRDRILKPYDRNGYLQINLVKLGAKRNFKIHRLVAQTFIPNPDGKGEVNHKDGNKHNNAVWNLEWNTRQENMDHAKSIGLTKRISQVRRKLTEQDVRLIRSEYIKGSKDEHGVLALAHKYKVSTLTIYNLLQGKTYSDVD